MKSQLSGVYGVLNICQRGQPHKMPNPQNANPQNAESTKCRQAKNLQNAEFFFQIFYNKMPEGNKKFSNT